MSETRSYTVELSERDGQLLEKLAAEFGFDEAVAAGSDTFGTFSFPAFIRMMVRIGIYKFEQDHETLMRQLGEEGTGMEAAAPDGPITAIDDDIPF